MMSDSYNGFYGGAISAEEFAMGLRAEAADGDCSREGQAGGPDCGQRDWGKKRKVCCFEVKDCHRDRVQVEEGCCCKEGFRAALGLLCDEELAELLDFEQTAFVTDHYVAGAAVTESVGTDSPADNLVAPLAGIFRRLSPYSCDLLDISATLYTPPATATGLTASQVSLCELVAAVIQLAEAEAEGELSPEEVAARNFRRVRRILSQRISPCDCTGGAPCCPCDRGDCCCAAGVLSALAESNLSRRVSVAAGPLLLSGVTLLGRVGNVLVLANDEAQRIYFVCVNQVEFIV